MIKVHAARMKKSGGPGIFMNRLLTYMQNHDMVRLTVKKPDIYFSTVLGSPPWKCKFVYRAAAAYYDTINQKKRHGFNIKIGKVVKKADHVIYQTAFARKMVQKILRVKAKRFTIINNGIDISPYANVSAYVSSKQHVFVACGNWTVPAKRGAAIVKSFLSVNIPSSELIMIGNGIKSKRSNVVCTGKLSFENIVPYLKGCSAFVHLCYVEACPNAVTEALAFGKPVICNNIGASPELVKEDGIIVQCDNPFVFKRRPVKLNLNYKPVVQAFRDILQKEWSVQRDNFNISDCAVKYLAVFEKVLR